MSTTVAERQEVARSSRSRWDKPFLLILGVVGGAYASMRWLRRRARVRAIERELSSS